MRTAGLAAVAVLLAGCASVPGGGGAGGCDLADGALDDAAFVIATAPAAGARVESGFGVSGCSRTFESTVVWRLRARNGSLLGQGTATGGGRGRAGAVRVQRAVHGRRAAGRPPRGLRGGRLRRRGLPAGADGAAAGAAALRLPPRDPVSGAERGKRAECLTTPTCATCAGAWRSRPRRWRPGTSRSARSWSARRAGARRGPQPRRRRRQDAPPGVRAGPLGGRQPDAGGAAPGDGLHLGRALPDVRRGARLGWARAHRLRGLVGAARGVANRARRPSAAGAAAADPGGGAGRRGGRAGGGAHG